jgi:hypothetical protein
MKEPFLEKIKRYLHGTFLFPHIKRKTSDGKGGEMLWCTCDWLEKID